jgi:predicted transcriptional regulator
MNESCTIEDLAYKCSDFGEHVDKVIEQINLGNLVKYSNTWIPSLGSGYIYNNHVNSNKIHNQIEDDNHELINKLRSNLSVSTTLSIEFANLIDEKTQELAEEAARSYTGKYL